VMLRPDAKVSPAKKALRLSPFWNMLITSGIFVGTAVFAMMPEAIERAGPSAWIWVVVGLMAFASARHLLGSVSHEAAPWLSMLLASFHALVELFITASAYATNVITGVLASAGLILHILPETAAAGLLIRASPGHQGFTRYVLSWLVAGAGLTVLLLGAPNLLKKTLGPVLASGASGFLYLAHLNWGERERPSKSNVGCSL
jgi:hypothetical protein